MSTERGRSGSNSSTEGDIDAVNVKWHGSEDDDSVGSEGSQGSGKKKKSSMFSSIRRVRSTPSTISSVLARATSFKRTTSQSSRESSDGGGGGGGDDDDDDDATSTGSGGADSRGIIKRKHSVTGQVAIEKWLAEPIVHSGNLKKMSTKGFLQRRYCQIRGPLILYWKSEKSSKMNDPNQNNMEVTSMPDAAIGMCVVIDCGLLFMLLWLVVVVVVDQLLCLQFACIP
jgi:hypothetical protein